MHRIFTGKQCFRLLYLGLFAFLFIHTSCKNEGEKSDVASTDGQLDESEYDLNLTCSNGYKIKAKSKGKEELDLVLLQDTLPSVEHELTLSPSGTGVRYRSEDRSILFWELNGDYSYEVNKKEICKCYNPAGEPMKSLGSDIFIQKMFAQTDKYPVTINNFTPLIRFDEGSKAIYYNAEKVNYGSFQLKDGIIQIMDTKNDTLATFTVLGASHLIDQENRHWTIKP